MTKDTTNSELRPSAVTEGGRTRLEDAVASIWAAVLGSQHVDKEANFFEIGGDSLKAMEVISRVSELLNMDLPLIVFFEEPTIRHLADVLSAGQQDTGGRLAKIWEEVLHAPYVDHRANFFDVGGDSLKAMEVIVRVSEVLHVDLPLIAFFEDPTVAHLASVVDELKAGGETPPIARGVERSEFPLSHSQQVFWLLEQQNPETGIYNKPRIFRIHGKVDPAVMERSLNELRNRHEVLRVRFVSGVNGPVQVVDVGGALPFKLTDLSALEPVARESMAMKLALETVRTPLDLAGGEVQRAHLIRFCDEEFLLCISEHHVVNDGFTGSILLDELGAMYDAFAAGISNPLPQPELHYTDYAVWERRWMEGQRLEDEMAYWRSLLRDVPTTLDLPTDWAPNSEPDRRGNLRTSMLPRELLRDVQSLAQANGTTHFTVMAAALRLLLARWTGQREFLLGTIASNRSRSGTERMPGPFVNPLPVRNAVVEDEAARALLQREKRAVMDAFAHQDCPFPKIVEAVNPERTGNDNPLFNVGLVMENFPEIDLKGRYFEAEYLNFDPEVSLLDLRFIAVEKDGALRLSCEYKSALFAPETVDALLQGYADVVATMVADPETVVAQFLLPEALQKQVKASAIARRQTVVITATYTAEPIQEPLEFWLKQLGLPVKVEFALFNLVFQQLLDPGSLLAQNQFGANVVLLRVEDLRTTALADFAAGVDEFLAALRGAAKRRAAPLIVVVGPPSGLVRSDAAQARAIEEAEARLAAEARQIAAVQFVSSAELLHMYPVADYADEYAYSISHVPYKPAFFTAIATMIARCIYASRRAAAEVIVLDGDSALDIDAVHNFLLAQEEAGVILGLCSREAEEAISYRLRGAAESRLDWQNIAVARCGVSAKSQAVKQMVKEVGLSLSRCVFVTGDSLDAAEVRVNCPDVIVAELPDEASAIAAFLAHFWAFDRSAAATDDQPPILPQSEWLRRVAMQFTNVDAVTHAVESSRVVRVRASGEYAAPRSQDEEFLVGVWSALLRVEGPSIHDNFFTLGGHSLLAAQVIARVRQTLGVELPLRAMFEAPTIAQFAQRIEAEQRSSAGVEALPMVRVPREGQLPLSFAQQRLWFIDQLEPGSTAYNISAMYRMRGSLNRQALERALNEIVRRHESLRMTFRNVDGHPAAMLSPELVITLSPMAVAGSDELEKEEELRRLAHSEASTPFDLASGPLIRARLLRLSGDDFALLIIVHHIVGDGWSGSLIAGELAALYGACSQDRPSPLPDLAIQYTDFAVWQRQWLQGEIRDRQLDYWRYQLRGAPAVLELPTDRQRPAVQSHRGDVRTHVIATETVEKLTTLSHNEGATLFMTLLAAFQVLLSRYSGQEDVVVASPVASRNYAEIEPLIGFFVNTLALRTDLSGNPTFRELVARVKQVALEGYAHQELPFERLVEELQPERSLSYNPIFQVLFALQNMPRQYFEASGLKVERSSIHQSTSILDMSWFAYPTADGLLLRVEYESDLFDGSTIDRMIGHFETLLEAITAHPDSHIGYLPLLGEAEKQRLLIEFNQTALDFPRGDLLHEFVARQADATADAVALVAGDERLTYRELNARANQLAHYLMQRGAGPEVLVGIYSERSLDMLVGILGILKSGSAYVPLDPNYPKERIRCILEDARVPLIVTQSLVAADLPEIAGTRVLLDTDWPAISRQPSTNPAAAAKPENLAYVLFTSGSTGRPKGVAIEHRSAAAFIHWTLQAFTSQELAGVLFSTSMCFDLSVFEIFAPLSSGGSVILAENALYLPTLPAKYMVTLINTVPSAMAELVRMNGVPDSVTTVNLAGEALSESLVESIYENTKVLRVYNLYGPTEDTTYSTYTLVPRGAPVTIGRPIANSQAYILDASLNCSPIGVPGELYLAGDGLARGYYGRDDLTGERFVPNPFSREEGARMYRTGDLCRYLPNGEILYLGRTDHQVKLRGFRIELGEIETVLNNHFGVRQCVVMARDDVPGQKHLVAYVVPQSDPAESGGLVADLRTCVSENLPEFMMPSAFVVLEAMPLSPNGKINRNALPAPDLSRDEAETFVAPRNSLEEKLSEIWCEVLRLPQVSVHDNFFRLGGHSLLATQVVSRVRKWAHVELPLRAMFEVPTVAELALRVEHLQVNLESLPPVRRVPRDRSLPLSFAQQRLWFLNQLEPDSPYYNIPMALRLSGDLDVSSLQRAFNEIIRRHEILRTTYHVEGDKPVQIISSELTIALPVDDLTHVPAELQEAAVRQMAIEAGRHVFNLQSGPLIRASVLKLAEQEHVLLWNTHHIANDGWSMWQFGNELASLYQAFRDNQPSPLPELPVQYADFAVWQQNWMQGDAVARPLEYWTKQLAGAPDTLELPTDFRRPAMLSLRGTTEKMVFPRELADRLNQLSRQEVATLFMTLLAAYQTLLLRYTRQEDIVVGSPIASRNRAEIEDLIGFFVNTLLMRTDLSGNPTFRELLQRVRTTALGAYSNQDLPFEKLVEVLHPERELGRIPLFQVWFVLQNAPRANLLLPGLELRPLDVHNGTAKFDLGLFSVEKPDGLHCSVEYSTDLFEASTIRRLLSHYRVLLESIVENPDQRIGELQMLPAEEQRLLLSEWNDPSRNFAGGRCIHELFERQVERAPHTTAVIFEGNTLTYHELNQRSNQLAHRLRGLGIGPETLVGICMERSPEMLVAILGVLKAGGGYLPLDPAYPKDRRAFMLEDALVPVLLTETGLLDEVPEHQGVTICLDSDWPSIANEPVTNPEPLSQPENVAYVIYTSGSTGKPKGVMVTHANVTRLFTSTDHWFGFGPQDTWTLFHSFAFDFSVWEIWGALLYGGRLVVVPLLTARSPQQFHELLVQQQVTVLNQTPSAFRHLIVADQESCNWNRLALRYVIFGGEALEFKSLLPWIEQHGDTPALINMYGITETTVHVTFHKIDTANLGEETVSIVGVPIPDLQVYVLDSGRQLAPIGVPGEMYVGGHGVARGYLRRPELTAERFIPDPFSADPNARLYKTGDLARFLPNASLQYLGRIDHQVKIRGFRIELGEIETTLDSHPGVRQSVVVAREDVPGDKRLVAYIVPDPDYRGGEDTEPSDALSSEQVSQWTEAFDEAYRRGGNVEEATFNIRGWDSSYTGQPIPSEEMRVWVESTADRIRALQPRSVWEIGCGTGLLLFRVAPGTERYYGTDISQTALGFLEQQLKRPELHLPHVKLERKAAHDFDHDSTRGQFDAVVLNSVVQYFPDLDYFVKVLEGAVESVRPGGTVFVGDLRSLPLLEAFHTSVEVFKADDAVGRQELARRVQKGIRQEGELLVDPELFTSLRQRWPQVTHVELQLKRGRAHNELTRFRYDVTLHIGQHAAPVVDCPWLDWRKQAITRASLVEILEKTQPEMFGLSGVPNARLRDEAIAIDWLTAEDGSGTVGDLRKRFDEISATAVEPEDLYSLEQELPYRVEIRASKQAADGLCDVVLRRLNPEGRVADYAVARFPGESEIVRPWAAYANNPLRQRVAAKLVPQLRLHVGGKLPEYMVPSAFVLLEVMPLTNNGKVNRRALPAPEQSRTEMTGEYRAPQTPLEEMIASIFADVLRLDGVGLDDNFFELGGHSLSATQVVSRIRQNLRVDLPVRTVFESPTVATLARAAEEKQRGEQGAVIPPIERVTRNQRLPLSFAQQRLWVLDQIEPNNPLYNIPRALQLSGELNVEALESALNGIVARHEVLRTNYGAEKGKPFQVIAEPSHRPLEVVDLSVLPAADREEAAHQLVAQEGATPFDLTKDLIIRYELLRLAEDDHILMVTTHHIADDGWSTGILLRELTELYEAALSGRPSPLPPLEIQYSDYAVWQRKWLQGEALERQVAYWRERLHGAPSVLQLPADRPRLEKPTFRGAIHRSLFPVSLLESVRALSRQQGGTAFMTLLAGFQTLVMHYTRQSDIVLGTDLANRTTVQTEALIGFFVNLLALRTDLSGDPTFSELLARVRETALGAYAHQDVPFDKLVEELQPERSLSHNPIVQVLFVQQNTPRSAKPMPGLAMSWFPMDVPSKFDMAVFVSETDKGLAGNWVYSSDLFDAPTIARMAGMYQRVLEKVTVNPVMRLSELLAVMAEEDQKHRATQQKEFQQAGSQRLKTAKRKSLT